MGLKEWIPSPPFGFAKLVSQELELANKKLREDMNRQFFGGNMGTGWLQTNDLRIEQVKNGYIISIGSEKYVFNSLKNALKFIEKYYTSEKE